MKEQIIGEVPHNIRHVIQFSGGVGSYIAAKRVKRIFGKEEVLLLFADTLIEDPDLYRFLDEAQEKLQLPLVKVSDGRTPWELFKDRRFLGNSRSAPCSLQLKTNILETWMRTNLNMDQVVIHLGIDWTEKHRIDRLIQKKRYKYNAPLCKPRYLSKEEMLKGLKNDGIEIPRLYTLGFPHNNCGGGCVKAGIAHFIHLLKTLPEKYKEWEEREEEVRQFLGRTDIAILKDRRNGEFIPMTLKQLRLRYEQGERTESMKEDWGGCGCALPN